MRYSEQLDATSAAVVALASRTAKLAQFRRLTRRRLSGDMRTSLAASATRLRSIAADLDRLASSPAPAEEIARLVAEARLLGVSI